MSTPSFRAAAWRVAALAIGLLSALPAAGGSASDGAVSVTYPPGHWSSVPVADFVGTLAGADADVVARSGWFYRVEGVDTREHPFPPPTRETWTGAGAEIVWDDVDGKGFSAREYVSVVDNERPSGTLSSQLMLLNLTDAELVVTVFHYLDASAGGAADGDLGDREDGALTLAAGPGRDVRYRGLGQPQHWMVRERPVLEELLGDGSPTELTDDGVPFGPGDWTGAYEWTLSLMPPGGTSYWYGYAGVRITSRVPRRVKGDVFGDGYPDLLLWKPGAALQVWGMRRTERLQAGEFCPESPRPAALDDFTGGPEADAVFVDPVTRQVSFRTLGSSAAEPLRGAPPLPSNWEIAATADFDHDGQADLLWFNHTSLRLVVWTMNGVEKSGSLLPSPDRAPVGGWRVVAAPDVDGDGNADLLWHNALSGKLAFWLLDAQLVRKAGAFTSPDAAASPDWLPVGAGDFGRGEGGAWGTADVVWHNARSGRLVVWHMDSAGRRTSGVFTSPDGTGDPAWQVVAPR